MLKALVCLWATLYTYARWLWENPFVTGWLCGIATVFAVCSID